MFRKSRIKLIVLFIFIVNIPAGIFSQGVTATHTGYGFSVIPHVSFISSSTLQLYALSNDAFQRSQAEEISGGYGYGLSIRKNLFTEDLTFGISIENINIKDDALTQTFSNDSLTVRARVTEELSVIPVEFTGYFSLPQFADNLEIYLGGGIGVYFGDRVRTILNLQSKTISKKPGYSLVILSGMAYKFTKQFSGIFELKFREAEYTVNSEYSVSEIKINGNYYDLPQELYSSIFVDGLKVSLGISYNF